MNSPSVTLQNHHSPRSILKGLLNHSHSSLESLVLNDFTVLQPAIDLHQSLPNLRKLRRLDISRISSISDDTLNLVSSSIGKRLEVLYMKGLKNVTNTGIVHLFESCTNLRVLDISEVHQLNDEAGVAIGQHLTKLEVLHCKDNYKLTNSSVDIITKNCKNLVHRLHCGVTSILNILTLEQQKKRKARHYIPPPVHLYLGRNHYLTFKLLRSLSSSIYGDVITSRTPLLKALQVLLFLIFVHSV